MPISIRLVRRSKDGNGQDVKAENQKPLPRFMYRKGLGTTTNSQRIAQHLREVHFGGNGTAVSLKRKPEGLTWQQTITTVRHFIRSLRWCST